MTSKRALRRHHNKRMFKRAFQKLQQWDYENNNETLTNLANRMYNNMQKCSCSMCCNERRNHYLKKYDTLSIQEKKALDDFKSQMEELNE